jgi:misacylated tRNA(Ala) deacylase
MTTELLYLADAYLREFDATVVGQPADTGRLGDARVTAVYKDDDGVVWHVVEPPAGDTVRGTIDWERRYLLMRTHMALHLVNAVAWRDHRARVTGAHMEPGKGRVDLELETMSKELGLQVEDRVNDYVARALPITTVYVPRSEAGDDVFRGKASSIAQTEDPIRTVHIGDVDRQACSGTHVASTSEIGPIRVTKTKSKGRANKRVEIELRF